MARPSPTEDEVLAYLTDEVFDRYKNWGRWGEDDELGTLNHLSPTKRKQAAALVKEGFSLSCARPITPERTDAGVDSTHFMKRSGETYPEDVGQDGEMQGASDWVGINIHGLSITHLDSVGHYFRKGRMYNGLPASRVTTREGATVQSVDTAKDGIVSRGVLLDVPRLNKVKWLEKGEPIFAEDLEAAEREAGVTVEQGDILLVRTGEFGRRSAEGPWALVREGRAGMHANCIPYLHERGVAVLATDCGADVFPPGQTSFHFPIHHVGIAGMGLWLVDNCNLEDLALACAARDRWQFLMCIAPLRIEFGTGSPVNPIAVF